MFTLLHTNDFHSHLNATQLDYLRCLRQGIGQAGLLLDAGDAVASGNITFRPGGEPILAAMTAAGYDAMTVGNREFHVSRMGFHCKVGMAGFPVLCANVRRSGSSTHDNEFKEMDTLQGVPESDPGAKHAASSAAYSQKPDPPTLSHIVRTLTHADGRTLSLVIFGLTVPMITERMLSRKVSAYIFENPLACAARLVPQLRAQHKPDLLIALTHIGYPQDRKLADAVPGIDLIVGGHSHSQLANGERVGDTLIVQTGCFAHHVGRVEIAPNVSAQRFDMRASLLPLPKQPTECEITDQETVAHL